MIKFMERVAIIFIFLAVPGALLAYLLWSFPIVLSFFLGILAFGIFAQSLN